MTRPEVAALHRALEDQGYYVTPIGDAVKVHERGEEGPILHLAPLVEAVLAAQWRPLTPDVAALVTDKTIEIWRPAGATGWDYYPGGGATCAFRFGKHAVWTPELAVAELIKQGVTHFRFPTPPPKDPPATA